MRTIINFIFRSSADPRKVSATVRGLLIGLIPLTLELTGAACGLGYCFDVDQNLLEKIVEGLAEITYWITLAVSALVTAYGVGRKVLRTITGRNLAIKQ